MKNFVKSLTNTQLLIALGASMVVLLISGLTGIGFLFVIASLVALPASIVYAVRKTVSDYKPFSYYRED